MSGPKRVLVAEDEPNIAESLRFVLERAGYEVAVAADGPKALDAALVDAPDVLVLDVMMPGMDGYEVLRRLRGDARGAALPVLVLSAKGQQADRDRAAELGADAFICKPFANAEVTEAVGRLARRRG